MNWYRLTSLRTELIAVEKTVPNNREECRQFDERHVCIVEAESIEYAVTMRCIKSMMR